MALAEPGPGCPVAVGQDALNHLASQRLLAKRPDHPPLLHHLLEVHASRSRLVRRRPRRRQATARAHWGQPPSPRAGAWPGGRPPWGQAVARSSQVNQQQLTVADAQRSTWWSAAV